jgi:hypothetical protein
MREVKVWAQVRLGEDISVTRISVGMCDHHQISYRDEMQKHTQRHDVMCINQHTRVRSILLKAAPITSKTIYNVCESLERRHGECTIATYNNNQIFVKVEILVKSNA